MPKCLDHLIGKNDDEQLKRKASSYSLAESLYSNKSTDGSKKSNGRKASNSSKPIDRISSKVNNGKSDLTSFTTNQNVEDDLKELSLDKIYEMASNGI